MKQSHCLQGFIKTRTIPEFFIQGGYKTLNYGQIPKCILNVDSVDQRDLFALLLNENNWSKIIVENGREPSMFSYH